LFLSNVISKTIHDYNAEREEAKQGEPPGSTFHSIQVRPEELRDAQKAVFAQALIEYRNVFEKPIIDAFKEVDGELEAERRKKRSLARQEYREKSKATRKPKPDKLTRYQDEKKYWDAYLSTSQIGHFKYWIPPSDIEEVLNIKGLQNAIATPEYDHTVIADDYGHQKQWTVEQHFTTMIPEEEIESGDLNLNDMIKREHVDFAYRLTQELEHVYGPLEEKMGKQIQYNSEMGRENLRHETLPDFWEVLNPDHITEFDNIEDPDKVTLAELMHRFDAAYDSWTKRLFSPGVDQKIDEYVKEISSGEWPIFQMNIGNPIELMAESGEEGAFRLTDADQIRIVKPQLLEAGLTKQTIKYDPERATPWYYRTPRQSIVMNGDEQAYIEFTPTYPDRGVAVLPPKVKKPKMVRKEAEMEEMEQFIEEIQMEERGKDKGYLSSRKRQQLAHEAKRRREDVLDEDQMEVFVEEQEAELDAHIAYDNWRKIWPINPVDHGGHIEGDKLTQFMKGDKWYPRNHLLANNPVEFFVRQDPIKYKPSSLDRMKYRKVAMKVNMNHFNLPAVVDKRLKELVGPRYMDRILKLTGDERQTQDENKAYLKLLFRELMHEAWKADPNYLPIREEEPDDDEDSWSLREAAAQVNKPILFRFFGYEKKAPNAQPPEFTPSSKLQTK